MVRDGLLLADYTHFRAVEGDAVALAAGLALVVGGATLACRFGPRVGLVVALALLPLATSYLVHLRAPYFAGRYVIFLCPSLYALAAGGLAHRRPALAVLLAVPWLLVLASVVPRAVQQADEHPRLGRRPGGRQPLFGAGDERVKPFEKQQAGRGDPAQHLPPVLPAALPPDEPLGFQPVEQARHSGRVLDQPLADGQRRHRLAARPAEDPQHVVLLRGDAVGSQQLSHRAPETVRRLQHGEKALMPDAAEGTRLPDLALKPAGGCRHGFSLSDK